MKYLALFGNHFNINMAGQSPSSAQYNISCVCCVKYGGLAGDYGLEKNPVYVTNVLTTYCHFIYLFEGLMKCLSRLRLVCDGKRKVLAIMLDKFSGISSCLSIWLARTIYYRRLTVSEA